MHVHSWLACTQAWGLHGRQRHAPDSIVTTFEGKAGPTALSASSSYWASRLSASAACGDNGNTFDVSGGVRRNKLACPLPAHPTFASSSCAGTSTPSWRDFQPKEPLPSLPFCTHLCQQLLGGAHPVAAHHALQLQVQGRVQEAIEMCVQVARIEEKVASCWPLTANRDGSWAVHEQGCTAQADTPPAHLLQAVRHHVILLRRQAMGGHGSGNGTFVWGGMLCPILVQHPLGPWFAQSNPTPHP